MRFGNNVRKNIFFWSFYCFSQYFTFGFITASPLSVTVTVANNGKFSNRSNGLRLVTLLSESALFQFLFWHNFRWRELLNDEVSLKPHR